MSENGWIHRDDQDPPIESMVMVAGKCGGVGVYWFGELGFRRGRNVKDYGSGPALVITHWRPLPEPPEPEVSERDEAILQVVAAAISRSPSLTVKFLSAEALRLINKILAEHEE